MQVNALFNKKRKAEIRKGLKKGKIPPRVKPRLPQPAAPALARTREEQEEIDDQLIFAARSGELESVRDALVKGADVEVKGTLGKGVRGDAETFGWTALMWASSGGHRDIVELLISKGADVNAIDNGGRTALMLATERGHSDIAELLISRGADVKAIDRKGINVLWRAVMTMQNDLAELLKKHGATR